MCKNPEIIALNPQVLQLLRTEPRHGEEGVHTFSFLHSRVSATCFLLNITMLSFNELCLPDGSLLRTTGKVKILYIFCCEITASGSFFKCFKFDYLRKMKKEHFFFKTSSIFGVHQTSIDINSHTRCSE